MGVELSHRTSIVIAIVFLKQRSVCIMSRDLCGNLAKSSRSGSSDGKINVQCEKFLEWPVSNAKMLKM